MFVEVTDFKTLSWNCSGWTFILLETAYVKILGFKLEYERQNFAFLSFQGSQLMIEKGGEWKTGELEHPFGRGINFQIEVDDVDAVLKRLKKNKYPIKVPVKENWYRKGKVFLGNREFLVMDPDGYLLRFAEDLGQRK